MSNPDSTDEDMNSATPIGSDDSDDGSSSDSDDNDNNNVEIEQLKQGLRDDPYAYDKYGKLIEYLSKAGELDELRNTRNAFAKHFPLSSEIWLSWLSDEKKIATTNEEKASVGELFEKAVKDYVSVDIWLEYCQFSLWKVSIPETGVRDIRATHERAVVAAGINGEKGALIWDAYREFEICLLDQDTTNEEQRARVDKLFRRQLAVPILGNDLGQCP